MTHAPIALSCGEPAGIGPEIAQLAWAELRESVPFFWIGDPGHLPLDLPWQPIQSAADTLEASREAMPVLAQSFDGDGRKGDADPRNASGVIDAIETAVRVTQSGEACAVCTAPIHKKALQDGANFEHPGHTEFLAALAGVPDVVMMLASPDMRVVPATIHIPLAEVPTALTPDGLRRTIDITRKALIRDFGIPAPRIAIAGLNPHAGEGGKIGTEEEDWINELIAELGQEDPLLRGPLPADTMFHARARAGFDAAICMYHDQALIPIKTLDFDGGVNVTLGLPFIRTSPDHGTAFDIAGKGIARPDSLIAALRMAQEMGHKRGTH
ncbi:4-hydroxythreonine-4-phosphate dehydrogenase PdxA [Shimia ponticola]|uniref:4-hydroxythreonine-4-phosphate dehydrogenase PdxA n=1 Tax=Shimia ponticola TaxID=2582893 RepID=UPI0011BE99DF|nr:4-hydroxythreonine-4-phosphate dehydrogenase PdxA [Shimia ponticola]